MVFVQKGDRLRKFYGLQFLVLRDNTPIHFNLISSISVNGLFIGYLSYHIRKIVAVLHYEYYNLFVS